MHETSLIKFTLEAVERRARELGIRHVSDIYLVVGELRGAIPEQMQAAFQILTSADQSPAPASNTGLFAGTRLSIDYRPILLRCRACGHLFPATLETYPEASCSSCGDPSPEIISGNELLIDSFRGE